MAENDFDLLGDLDLDLDLDPIMGQLNVRAEAELKDEHFGFCLKSIGRYLKILWLKNDFDLFGDLDLDLDPMTSKMKWSHPGTIAHIW